MSHQPPPAAGNKARTIWDWWDWPKGPCPHKLAEDKDCLGQSAMGPVICNQLNMADTRRNCPRYLQISELRAMQPDLWEKPCYPSFRYLAARCMETSGSMTGCLDILVYPNDKKVVWRNFERVQFTFCPLCGQPLLNSDKTKEQEKVGR